MAEDPDNIFVMGITLYTDNEGENIKIKILRKYSDYADIFWQEKMHPLPHYTKCDHHINLIPDAKLPDGPIYHLSRKELEAQRDYIRQVKDYRRIRRCSWRIYAPILFVSKPN